MLSAGAEAAHPDHDWRHEITALTIDVPCIQGMPGALDVTSMHMDQTEDRKGLYS
jgi:hypothetical protein